MFAFTKDHIWKRINSLRGWSLSKAGKKVMIKLVFQSLPSYITSVYLILDAMVNNIENMLNSFWWADGVIIKGYNEWGGRS